jgi:hypothetical protein
VTRGLEFQQVGEISISAHTWREASLTLVSSTSTGSISTPSCSVAASHSLAARGRRSAFWQAIELAKM